MDNIINNLYILNSQTGGNKVSSYPAIDDDNFQQRIKKIYSKYQITEKPTFKEFCFPTKFTYQLPQLFVSEFINPNTPYTGLLLFHKIGAGKTCAAINIAEQWKHKKKIMIACPASLIGNFYKELRSMCAKNNYISQSEKKRLDELEPGTDEYDLILTKVKKRIDKYYTILSYNKFVTLSQTNKLDLSNYLLIIDEVQNIVSEHGIYYQTFLSEIHNAPRSLRVIIMSATPIFDKPIELSLTINLLKPKEQLPLNPTFNDLFLKQQIHNNQIIYNIKNIAKLKKLLMGYVSYYQGAPQYVFPRKTIKIVKCIMSSYQYSCYKTIVEGEGGISATDILKLPNNFFIGSRMISNIAFPNKLILEEGFNAFKGKATKINEDLKKYSIKFYKILRNIKKCEGTVFVYSNFREYGGLESFIRVLENNGYKNYDDHDVGKNRFAIWSGKETLELKEHIREIFNKKENQHGNLIKIILGSPAIKEGVSLLRVRQVHIIEPYWNMSRLEQVMGRAIRFCSHKDMSSVDRDVNIFIYVAIDPLNKKLTVDKHILNMAYSKDILTKQFEQVIIDSAVDKLLFQN